MAEAGGLTFRALIRCGLRCGCGPGRGVHVLLSRALRARPGQSPASRAGSPCGHLHHARGRGVCAWAHPHFPGTTPEPLCSSVPLPGRSPGPSQQRVSRGDLSTPFCPQASHGAFQPGLLPVSVSALQGVATAGRQYPRTGGPQEESGVGCTSPRGEAGRAGGQGVAGQHLPAAAAGWGRGEWS